MGLVLDAEGRAVSVTTAPFVALRETLSLVQRQVEDRLWTNVSSDGRGSAGIEDSNDERRATIERARVAVKRNPLAKVAVNLLQHYTLGQGISVKAQNRKIVAKLVDEFMEHPVNQKVLTSHQAQNEFLEAAFTDGDQFIVMFPDEDAGTLTLGLLDPMYVEDTISDPENAKVTHWYRVLRPKKSYDFVSDAWKIESNANEVVYYRDWQNDMETVPVGLAAKLQKGLVMQVSFDKRGKFGRSQLATALDWLRAHREFMEDRATINRAAASVAWRKKRKGPASDIAAEANRLQSALVGNPARYETNPARATAATIVENENSTLDWVKTETGGAAADFDERKGRMMAGAGMGGIPNHYFGDEAASNLATATAMELPLLKAYEASQQWLRMVLTDVIQFMLQTANKAGRLPDRDDSSRYADRDTTPQAVMDRPEATAQPGMATATVVGSREAIALPYAPPPLPGLHLIPKPDDAREDPTPKEDPNAPITWYVDIDFPPIVQKQIDLFMSALAGLQTMLPGSNIESQKLVVELALQTFGVNDIDQTMTRLFPPDMVAVVAPPPPPPPVDENGKPIPAGPPQPIAESIATLRRRRLLRVADETAELAEAIGG